jgi:predicted transcriptional regulator
MGNQVGLSDSEREVLKALWDRGSGTVREVMDLLAGRGRRWAYTTVGTLLQRLVAKGYVSSDPTSVPHVFRASVSREELLGRRLKDAANELCDGRAAPLVLALVQEGRFTPEELDRMRQMLDEAAVERPAPTRPRDQKKPSR